MTANRIYNASEKDGLTLAKLERATPQLAIQGYPQAQVRPDEAELARQHVVLWRRRLSDAAQPRHADQIGRRHPRGRARQDHARRQQRGVVEPHLRRHRQGGAEPERQCRARLHRRGADVPRHAAQGDRRPVRRDQLGEDRPAPDVGKARIQGAGAVRPHQPPPRLSRCPDRARAGQGPRRCSR